MDWSTYNVYRSVIHYDWLINLLVDSALVSFDRFMYYLYWDRWLLIGTLQLIKSITNVCTYVCVVLQYPVTGWSMAMHWRILLTVVSNHCSRLIHGSIDSTLVPDLCTRTQSCKYFVTISEIRFQCDDAGCHFDIFKAMTHIDKSYLKKHNHNVLRKIQPCFLPFAYSCSNSSLFFRPSLHSIEEGRLHLPVAR